MVIFGRLGASIAGLVFLFDALFYGILGLMALSTGNSNDLIMASHKPQVGVGLFSLTLSLVCLAGAAGAGMWMAEMHRRLSGILFALGAIATCLMPTSWTVVAVIGTLIGIGVPLASDERGPSEPSPMDHAATS